ncbi:MAG: hypothetical protein AAF988_06050 [Pseudomonadota bacterium]
MAKNNAAKVTELASSKTRLESTLADSKWGSLGFTFQDISEEEIAVEKLRDEYDVAIGSIVKEDLLRELVELEKTAREDQQMTIQGSPIDRDLIKFGNASMRVARRERIIQKLAP